MGNKWIVVVRTATSDVTSEVTIEEFDNREFAEEHFDNLRVAGGKIIDAYMAIVHTERHA